MAFRPRFGSLPTSLRGMFLQASGSGFKRVSLNKAHMYCMNKCRVPFRVSIFDPQDPQPCNLSKADVDLQTARC